MEVIQYPNSPFKLHQPFPPAGDQPTAIAGLLEGLSDGLAYQTLLGVTGSGKTYTMANVIAQSGRPAIIMAHNKTLAAQLYAEMREFFPENAVEYFVSYYDYYQPEAYVPSRDLFIEKDSAINEHIEQMRLSATKNLMTRDDVIIVATVSAIYGIGDPTEYQQMVLSVKEGDTIEQRDIIATLNPYPAYGFASSEPTAYIQPDVWVKEGKDGWKVIGNEAAWPKLQLNREYCELMKSAEDGAPEWKEKINEAKQRIDSLELRKSTVIRLAEYIVKNQEDFFIFGEIGLAPMLMKDAAAELGLAESTISRAANQKYLSCPRGLFALRYFFTQAVNSEGDKEGLSQGAIKAVLGQIIENEDSSKPHSDETLVRLLKQQGIDIARRTVAKYRESLDIPPAHKRKLTE